MEVVSEKTIEEVIQQCLQSIAKFLDGVEMRDSMAFFKNLQTAPENGGLWAFFSEELANMGQFKFGGEKLLKYQYGCSINFLEVTWPVC